MTPKQLMKFIQNRPGAKYHITHACRIMHSWNLCQKVPQKIHVNAVLVSECHKWRRLVSLAIKNSKRKGFFLFLYRINLCFSTTHEQIKNIGFMDQSVLYHGSHQKIIVYGMHSNTGQNFFR